MDVPIRWDYQGKWRGDAVGYLGAHHRLYRARGRASAQQCAHCDRNARHWAYDHTDPHAKTSRDGLYSTDVNRYIPLCGSCHKKFDIAYARTNRALAAMVKEDDR